MDFYVDGGGNVLRVSPQNVYQGSANANVIRFIGAFPSSFQVTATFELPTGDTTTPYLMSPAGPINGVVDQETGATFNIWECNFGVRVDSNGKKVPDYTITANAGVVGVQFQMYCAGADGVATVPTSARSSFVVSRGNPANFSYNPADASDIRTTLAVILSEVGLISESFSDIDGLLGVVLEG